MNYNILAFCIDCASDFLINGYIYFICMLMQCLNLCKIYLIKKIESSLKYSYPQKSVDGFLCYLLICNWAGCKLFCDLSFS